ncbi:MAG: TatD family hydrolase [Actinomycetota bacterium]|nr:TatD family hydrolase [Actinomycetota bacterium]
MSDRAGVVAGAWTDSHCHLPDLPDLGGALERAVADGVARVVCIGTGLESSRRAVEVAREASGRSARGGGAPETWATVGLHPHDATDGVEPVADLARSSAPDAAHGSRAPGSVVGIGECGLDYHYDRSPRDRQREVFAAQVALARELSLTLVVHTREAWDDTFAILASEGVPERTVVHCFTGGPDEVRRCLDVGAYVSFSGIVTFAKAPEVREAAAICPLDRVLVETDAPYLAPVPYRGETNEPRRVTVVGEAVAAARGVAPEVVARATWENAASAFLLPPVAAARTPAGDVRPGGPGGPV